MPKLKHMLKSQDNTNNILVIHKIIVPLHSQFRNELSSKYRGVEQLVARQAHNLEVARSNPASATKLRRKNQFLRLFFIHKNKIITNHQI